MIEWIKKKWVLSLPLFPDTFRKGWKVERKARILAGILAQLMMMMMMMMMMMVVRMMMIVMMTTIMMMTMKIAVSYCYVRGSHVLSGAEDEVQWVRRAASLKLGPRLLVVIYVLIWWSVKRCDKNREGGCQGAKWVGQYLMPPQTWAGWECGQNVCSIASHLTCITPRAMGCGWALLPLTENVLRFLTFS